MILYRIALGAFAALSLVACSETRETAAFDASDTASLCKRVKSLSLTAQRDSFSFSFAQADQKFARLITLYDTEDVASRCPTAPSKAFLLASQGLALSNQEQFRLAEAAFDAAQADLDAQDNPSSDEALLLKNFRVQDSLNRGAREETARGFDELGTLLEKDRGGTIGSLAADDLFAPDDASIRRVAGIASSEYVRSISLVSDLGGSATKDARLIEAEAAIDRGIDLIGAVPSASAAYLPRFLIQKAVVQLEQGKPSLARVNAGMAAESLNELLPGTPLGARALLVKAKAEADDGDRMAALTSYSDAFSVYEENPVPIRSASVWPFFRIALEEGRRDASQLDTLNAAMFRAAQIVRSSVAAKTISGAAALFSEGESDAARAVRNWQSANDTFGLLKAAQIQSQFDNLTAPDTKAALSQDVARAEAALEVALAERDRLAPSYRTALDTPIGLSDVQAVLKPGEALVQVLTGEPRNVIFLVEPDNVRVFAIPVTEGIAEEVITILRSFVEAEPSGEFESFAADAAHLAFQLLMGEAGPELLGFDRLIFSVSGPMASLPLEMLVVAEPDSAETAAWRNGDYTDIAWLGAQADISYVPSPRNLVDIRVRAGESAAKQPVIAFGDFQPGANADAFLDRYDLDETCRQDARAVAGLERLPETATEARLIAAKLGTPDAVRLGSAFTKERFEAERDELSDFRILHFATHGLLWPSPDCLSEPALAVSVSDGAGDPLLTAREIRGLKLDAQLVVLSACEVETAFPVLRGPSLPQARGR